MSCDNTNRQCCTPFKECAARSYSEHANKSPSNAADKKDEEEEEEEVEDGDCSKLPKLPSLETSIAVAAFFATSLLRFPRFMPVPVLCVGVLKDCVPAPPSTLLVVSIVSRHVMKFSIILRLFDTSTLNRILSCIDWILDS